MKKREQGVEMSPDAIPQHEREEQTKEEQARHEQARYPLWGTPVVLIDPFGQILDDDDGEIFP
jgi:hypothetical protein